MAKLQRNLKIIDLVNDSSNWKNVSTSEYVADMKKQGILSPDPKSPTKLILQNKTLYKNANTGEIHVLKPNSFKTPDGIKLETSTAVNEFMLDRFISRIATKHPEYQHLRDLFVEVDLRYVYSPSNKGGVPNKKVFSETIFQEGFSNRKILMEYNPTVAASINTSHIPIDARTFMAIVGKRVTFNDVLFNDKGDIKIIDLADSSPMNLEVLTIPKFFQFLDAQPKEEAIQALERGIDMLNVMLQNITSVRDEVYSIYNKINLEEDVMNGKRPTGLKLYEKIWTKEIVLFQNKINTLNGIEADIDPTSVLNITDMLNNLEAVINPKNRKPSDKNTLKNIHNLAPTVKPVEPTAAPIIEPIISGQPINFNEGKLDLFEVIAKEEQEVIEQAVLEPVIVSETETELPDTSELTLEEAVQTIEEEIITSNEPKTNAQLEEVEDSIEEDTLVPEEAFLEI